MRAPDVGSALGGISSSQLSSLLSAVSAGGHLPTFISNQRNQALGLVVQPTAAQAQQARSVLAPVVSGVPGVTLNSVDLAALDLEQALLAAQSARASQLDGQLASQLSSLQTRNSKLALLNTALTAVRAYLASPSDPSLSAAVSATKAAGISHAFLTASAPNRVAEATALTVVLRGMIDAEGNSQQMEMLRLQSLSNKRSEAFDVMTNFVKKMQEGRSSIIGNMRSTPVSLGTVTWNGGAIAGAFDLTGVTNGRHHLILNFADAGVTLIADVTVQRGALAATGSSDPAPVLGAGVGLLALGAASLLGASLHRRRHATG